MSIKTNGYTIESTGKNTFVVYSPCGWFSNHGIFYHGSKDTKMFHKANLKRERESYGQYYQLIGMDSEITNKRVYTRIINARIRGEL